MKSVARWIEAVHHGPMKSQILWLCIGLFLIGFAVAVWVYTRNALASAGFGLGGLIALTDVVTRRMEPPWSR